jgi:hypothetical protein
MAMDPTLPWILSISAIRTRFSWLYFHLMLLIACSHLMW